MSSKLFKKAIGKITKQERAMMVRSLEILSQIHSIMKEEQISQVDLADKLKISEAAVSKMLATGNNLELKSIIEIECALGKRILITPKMVAERICPF